MTPYFHKNKGKASHFRTYFHKPLSTLEISPFLLQNPFSPFYSDLEKNELHQQQLPSIGVIPLQKKSSAKLILTVQGNFIFAQKKDKHSSKNDGSHLEHLEFLGGHLDDGETPIVGLLREIQEEDPTGLLADLFTKNFSNTPSQSKLMVNWSEQHYLFFLNLDQSTFEHLLQKLKDHPFQKQHEHSRFVMMSKELALKELRGRPDIFTKKTQVFLHRLLNPPLASDL
jgi:8-oxo-dGTP pyrophosphatase MutT (NUDIX family)